SHTEYEVKAVYIYNFAHFIKWSDSAFEQPDSPFVIGVLGGNVFDSHLEEVIKDEKIQDHPIQIKYFKNIKEVQNCHILFINKSYRISLQDVYTRISSPVLTISDANNFTESSGMIRFYTEDQKIKFEINAEAVAASGLEVSSKLLRIAKLYTP